MCYIHFIDLRFFRKRIYKLFLIQNVISAFAALGLAEIFFLSLGQAFYFILFFLFISIILKETTQFAFSQNVYWMI